MFIRKKIALTAAILAGGKNSRIETEKSLLELGDVPIIDRLVEVLEPLFEEVIIVTGKKALINRFPKLKISADFFIDTGPLAGIHTALKTASYDAVFVFACDMPLIDPMLISRMADEFMLSKIPNSILVPKHQKGLEPLHSIYSKKTLAIIEKQLMSGRYKISDFYHKAHINYFEVSDSEEKSFYNINTRDDYEELLKKTSS